ncbi:MAG: sulfatase-like hydrolase/transferase [Planctomycetes bacterium]|nr:sulfatase-like hydrolase/transferase [Planctomycetota bacterium]
MADRGEFNRREFMKGLAGAGTAAVLGNKLFANEAFAGKGKRPNVLLIVSDDHGLDAVGCYGNKVIKTPNLDKLAGEGTRFTHAFCTAASCSASRSVILTGMHNHATGQYGLGHKHHHFSTFGNVKSLPVLLGASGYRTGRVGKFHVEPESVYKFDVTIKAWARSTVDMAEKCKDFVNANGQPFFLYYCTTDPHRSLPYRGDKPNSFGNRPGGYPGEEQDKYESKDVIVPPFLPDIPETRSELSQYYQSVSRIDQGVGKLIEILKESGKYDDTLIIYISDNGIAFNGAKTTLYEAGIRLPCIVRNPYQKKRGIVSDAMITWTDITPTILDFCGVESAVDFHGRSFLSVLEKERCEGWDEIYASQTVHEVTMYYPMRTVRGRKYKLIYNIEHKMDFPFGTSMWSDIGWQKTIKDGKKYYGKRSIDAYIHRPKFELYDLEKDPDEINNLAGDSKFAKVLEELKGKLKAFQQKTKDPWVHKWDYDKNVLGKDN